MMSEAASDCKTGCNYASSSVAPSPAQKQHRERHRTSWSEKMTPYAHCRSTLLGGSCSVQNRALSVGLGTHSQHTRSLGRCERSRRDQGVDGIPLDRAMRASEPHLCVSP